MSDPNPTLLEQLQARSEELQFERAAFLSRWRDRVVLLHAEMTQAKLDGLVPVEVQLGAVESLRNQMRELHRQQAAQAKAYLLADGAAPTKVQA